MRCGEGLRNVGTCAKAGIGQPRRSQLLERASISLGADRLYQHRLGPIQTEPAKIFVDAVDKLPSTARLVEVLDPQPELTAAFPRPGMANGGAIGVPKV